MFLRTVRHGVAFAAAEGLAEFLYQVGTMDFARPKGRRPKDPEERFWLLVEKTKKCWLWLGHKARGYGRFRVGSRSDGTRRLVPAHLWIYERRIAPVPLGLELDHTCKNKACVRPSHLEPVTHAVNVQRGPAAISSAATHRAKKLCPRGHLYSLDNTYVNPSGHRVCRTCIRIRACARKAA